MFSNHDSVCVLNKNSNNHYCYKLTTFQYIYKAPVFRLEFVNGLCVSAFLMSSGTEACGIKPHIPAS